jgi:hypothetical protein
MGVSLHLHRFVLLSLNAIVLEIEQIGKEWFV